MNARYALLAFLLGCHRGPAIPIYVDDAPAGSVPIASLGERAALTTFLPAQARDATKWHMLEAETADGRRLHVQRPAQTYAGQNALLYLDEQKRPSLGLFRPDQPGLAPAVRELAARPTVSLSGVVAIRVRVHERPPVAVATHRIEVVADGQPKPAIGADDLSALPVREPPHGGKAGARDLLDVVALRVPRNRVGKLHLVGKPEAVDVDTRVPRIMLLKFNRKGEARVRCWDQLGRVLFEIRDLARIEVAQAP